MKNIEYYMALPYTKTIEKVKDESGEYYIGRIIEIPEAVTNANNLDELEEMFNDVLRLSIECRLKNNEFIPEPIDTNYNGKFVLRMPKELHKNLSIIAKNEGVSLNQYILYKLSK